VRLALAAVLCAAVAGAPACASRLRDPLVQPSVIGARERHVRRLQADLAAILAAGVLQRGLTAVEVASLDRRDVLFRYNADRLVMPASNMKILTLAAAAERLGWDYTFETILYPTGPVLDGTLQGDLVIRGNGDPSLNARQLLPGPVLDAWADVLAASGIRRIAGRLVGDDNAFDEESFGQGWPLDDLEEGYSAPVGALQVYEDAVTVSIAAGEAPGLPAHVALATPGSGWAIDNRAMTGAIGTDPTIAVHRARGALLVHVTGNIPAASEGITRSLAVDNPTTYLLGLLATALERRGITLGGGIADIDELPRGSVGAAGAPLVVYRSPPLREIARTMMTVSQNLYAETLLRAVGQVEGGAARAADGKAAVLAVLNAWGALSRPRRRRRLGAVALQLSDRRCGRLDSAAHARRRAPPRAVARCVGSSGTTRHAAEALRRHACGGAFARQDRSPLERTVAVGLHFERERRKAGVRDRREQRDRPIRRDPQGHRRRRAPAGRLRPLITVRLPAREGTRQSQHGRHGATNRAAYRCRWCPGCRVVRRG
jgi:PBP4 family serine-type D-alanyl-D-alanine carboxypeptidase